MIVKHANLRAINQIKSSARLTAEKHFSRVSVVDCLVCWGRVNGWGGVSPVAKLL